MNLTASLSLQVLCQLIGSRAPYSDDANIVISNPSAISNQSPPPVQPATLPDDYIAYPEIGAAYKMIFNEVTWSEAREQCNLEGAHLAILDSKKKLEYVWNATYYTHHRTSDVVVHTGIYRMDKKWVDVSTGRTLSALPWHSGYPNDSYDDCTAIDLLQQGAESRLFNPRVCSNQWFYLCEVPIPKDYKTQEFQTAHISVN